MSKDAIASPNRPSVFISSTSEDLKPYREAAHHAVIGAGCFPIQMEYFKASGQRPPLEACLHKVDEADVLVLIVAHRYGWVPDDQQSRFRVTSRIDCRS